jgi:hypothetical protein
VLFKKPSKNEQKDKVLPKRGSERRQHVRIEKNYVLTYYYKNNLGVKIEITQLKNISKGGMCFVSSRSFSPGEELGIELKTPFIAELTYLEGRILASHQKAEGLIYDTRLEFVDLGPHGEFLLDKLIEFIHSQDKPSDA